MVLGLRGLPFGLGQMAGEQGADEPGVLAVQALQLVDAEAGDARAALPFLEPGELDAQGARQLFLRQAEAPAGLPDQTSGSRFG